MNTRALALLATFTLLIAPVAQAARPVLPPLTELTTNQYNLVMAARAVEKLPPNRVRFVREEGFAGEVKESETLRVDEETFARITVDERYVVAYSYVTSNPQFRESKFEDPEGPRMIKVRGYGSPALFEDLPETRFLFEAGPQGKSTQPLDVVEALTRLMERPDASTRALAVVEFLLRPDLHAIVRPAHAERIARVVTDAQVEQELRAFLLEVAVALPDRSQRWMGDACRSVLAELDPQFDLVSHGPQLAERTLIAMGDHASVDDVQAMVPFLQSNAPRVVTAAIESMELLLLRAGRAQKSP
ncbi:MAG: hypothetical protein AAFX85_01870 [Pseudomonadota bacterium]